MTAMNKTVAVITTTIGRPELEQTIQSVQRQTYPCQHYVFIDGKQYWDNVKHLEQKYPDVIFTFLPMNTGGRNRIGNGAIHAILPYLLQEDIFCFIDDDNWYDENHVKYLAEFIAKHNLDYAYSLRRLYTPDYQFLCDDNIESLGFWKVDAKEVVDVDGQHCLISTESAGNLIDTNTYGITRNMSFNLSRAWYSGIGNDKKVFDTLLKLNARGGCTAKRTVNYKLNLQYQVINGTRQEYDNALFVAFFKRKSEEIAKGKMEWLTPCIVVDNKMIFFPEETQAE